MGTGKAKRVCFAFFCVFLLCAFLFVGFVHAVVSEQSITGTVSNVQGYTIFLQGNGQGFYLAATSTLTGISLSNLDSLVGESVTITYRTVSDKNAIVTLTVNISD